MIFCFENQDNYQSQINSQISFNQQYIWEPKKEKLNWGVAENIDVESLVRRGDLNSILFYWDQFRKVNITKDDLRKFGSKGCLNIFLIMQLGSEIFYNEKRKMGANSNEEQCIHLLIEDYNQKINIFRKEIDKREDLISRYKNQNEELKKRLYEIKKALYKDNIERTSILKSEIAKLKKKTNEQTRVQEILYQQKIELEEELSQKNKEIEKYKLKHQRKISNRNNKQISSNELTILNAEKVENLENLGQIGQGTSGCVIKVCNKLDLYALKIMKNGYFEDFQRFFGEYEILNSFNHPNIMQTFGIFLSEKNKPPSILLEFCPTNVFNIIKDKKISNADLIFYIYQIVEGMKYVHFRNIIHRDLKPTNIMIGNDGLIKIGDFGISKLMTTEEQSMTCGVGTQKFMAPEIIDENKNYNNKVDVYSFGILLFFLLSGGNLPTIKMSDKMNGKKPEIPRNFTLFAHQLIDMCLNFKSKDRPSFSQIIDELERNDYNLAHLNDDERSEIKNKIKEHNKKLPKY